MFVKCSVGWDVSRFSCNIFSDKCLCGAVFDTHTHTHTHIYIYIYIYTEGMVIEAKLED